MITSDELEYLVKEAINSFRKPLETNGEYYEDVAWDYARGILGNRLRGDEKQSLYSKLIKKLNEEYKKRKIEFSAEKGYKIQFSNVDELTIVNTQGELEDKKEAILLFLMDYNSTRFIRQVKKNKSNDSHDNSYDYSKLKKYIEEFLRAIDKILSEEKSISRESYKNAFNYVKKYIREETKTNEYVAPAKILMLLNPNKFIAWDNQIAKRFILSLSSESYERFNSLIDDYISKKKEK